MFVWPNNICQKGNENWLKGTDLVFLKPYAAWCNLRVDSELGVCTISAEETYIQFIFPKFSKMNEDQRYSHLKHIRDYLIDENYVHQNSRKYAISSRAIQFISGLKQLPCMGNDGEPLQLISSFCTHKKAIFTTFAAHFTLLPKYFLQTDYSWMPFFRKLGLREKVTQREYLQLCNDVANGKLTKNTRTASKVLLEYLFSPEEAELHGFHSNSNFLRNVSDIAFVCSAPLPELEWIHKVPQTPNCVILAEEQIPMCKLAGACLRESKKLVWTVLPVVAVSEYEPKNVLKGLGIDIQPNAYDVITNMVNISKTCFSEP